jgi:hypothetical protein
VPPHAVLHERETLGIRGGFALVVANVDVDERRPRFERFVRRFDLLRDAEGDRRVLRLLRQRTRDRDADDERLAGRG